MTAALNVRDRLKRLRLLRVAGEISDWVAPRISPDGRQALKPICAVCNKPVDDFHESYSPFLGRIEWVARCHGRIDRVELSEREIAPGAIHMGKAFTEEAARLLPKGTER